MRVYVFFRVFIDVKNTVTLFMFYRGKKGKLTCQVNYGLSSLLEYCGEGILPCTSMGSIDRSFY